jgi:dihydrofolate reductase
VVTPSLDVMTTVVADITISLDGFVTGPGADRQHGLGIGGEPLHTWVMEPDSVDTEVLQEAVDISGAVVMGRNLFDVIDGPDGWNDEMGYGAGLAGTPPFVVVTHAPPETVRLGLDFTFVTDGVAAAIDQARLAAGDKSVVVMGGGDVIRQSLDLGLLDELRMHLSPIVLGAGTPLFSGSSRHELVQRTVRVSRNATHLIYDVAR